MGTWEKLTVTVALLATTVLFSSVQLLGEISDVPAWLGLAWPGLGLKKPRPEP